MIAIVVTSTSFREQTVVPECNSEEDFSRYPIRAIVKNMNNLPFDGEQLIGINLTNSSFCSTEDRFSVSQVIEYWPPKCVAVKTHLDLLVCSSPISIEGI
jgi:hypothetical protein